MSLLMLILGAVSLSLTAVSLRPVRWPASLGLASFLLGWTTGDLPVLQVILQGTCATALAGMGALDSWVGWLGLSLLVVAWAGLFRVHAVAVTAHAAVERALVDAGVVEPGEDWRRSALIRPFPLLGRAGVSVRRNVVIGEVAGWKHRVDVFRPVGPGEGRPVLVFAHGGGWVMSFREFQGLPVIHRLVERGWIVVRTNYRLSPWVKFPDHLIDLKRAIAWTREHSPEWGGAPSDFLALHGNSAGAHLAALAALSPNDPKYQPGFEAADTSVDACVPVYGPMDMTNRHGDWGPEFDWFMRLLVIGQPRTAAVWAEASPMDQIRPNAPPFFLLHGELDTLVPVGESHRFAAAMRAVGNSVDLAIVPGGQHALDIWHSRRGVAAADGIVRWLEHRRSLATGVAARA